MKRFKIGTLIVVFLLVSLNFTKAEEASIYCGFSLGIAHYTGDTITGDGFIPGQKLKDSTRDFKVFLGYQVNRYLSFEIKYVNLGEVSEKFKLDPNVRFFVPPNDTVTFRIHGLTFSPLFEYPMTESLSLLGLLGVSYLKVNYDVSGGFGPGTSTLGYSSSNTETNILYGMGFKYSIINNLKMRLLWEHYNTDITNINLVEVSVEYRF